MICYTLFTKLWIVNKPGFDRLNTTYRNGGKDINIYPCIDPVGIEIRHHQRLLLDVEDAVSVVIVLGEEHLDLHVGEVAPRQ
jgi:hypothetical protein